MRLFRKIYFPSGAKNSSICVLVVMKLLVSGSVQMGQQAGSALW